jgi:catalase
VGTPYQALPVNRPRCAVHHHHRDGAMGFFGHLPNADAHFEHLALITGFWPVMRIIGKALRCA